MKKSELGLSNTSFTNKDFEDIYPELLELAKKLSYKWDPTVSNESDPGVTLIREIALALDKINYASDKNALETMPLSVTQQRTARQLFQLLGYYPKWYIGTEVNVSLSWNPDDTNFSDNDPTTAVIPAFTQIVDDSGDYVYTLPHDVPVKSNGEVSQTVAIQGIVKPQKINNTDLITFDLLDPNRRVYFEDYNVAQNGVFIFGDNANEVWEQRDNLGVEEVGNTYYSFNVDVTTNRCYVEFPVDIADLIGDGLHINYLVTSGREGAVMVGQLTKLYNSQETCNVVESGTYQESTVVINNDSLSIQNTDLVLYGKDPESIDSMYENYNHIKGTFDTLVTLRDYNNAAYETEKCSNAVVTDRTNDVQKSYRIMSQTVNSQENVIYVQEGEDKISPFGLKIYALQYNDIVDTNDTSVNQSSYNNTFEMFADLDVEDPFNIDSSLKQLADLLNSKKCVQHDFLDIEKRKICLIKNVAEISMTVFPKVTLTDLQKRTLVNDIRNEIYSTYNARRVNFGEEINYDDLFSNLISSSQYIKNLSLNQIQYYAYAMYYSDGESVEWSGSLTDNLKSGWRQVCISDETDYIQAVPAESFTPSEDSNGNVTYNGQLLVNFDEQGGNGEAANVVYKGKHPYLIATINEKPYVFYLDGDNNIKLYTTMRKDFRKTVYVRNVLAGITPLFVQKNNNFKYQIDEDNKQYIAENLDITTDMLFDFISNPQEATYGLKPNETIQLRKQQLIDQLNYGAYVKYDYVGGEVKKDQPHKLTADEQLVIYYKTEDSDSAPYVRVKYGKDSENKNTIIQPSFNLTQTTDSINFNIPSNETPSSAMTCSANQSISIKKKNQVKLNSSTKIYVIGNQVREDDGKDYYELTLKKEDDKFVTELQSDEQFIYSSGNLSVVEVVGSGTRIELETSLYPEETEVVIKVISVPALRFAMLGVGALESYWENSADYGTFTVIGQEFINVLGAPILHEDGQDQYQSQLKVEPKDGQPVPENIKLTRDGFYWENASGNEPVLRQSDSAFTKVDGYDSVDTDLQSDIFNDFVLNEDYYAAPNTDSFSKSIEFETLPYPQGSISVYTNGIRGQISGTLSDVYDDNYQFIFNGAEMYLTHKVGNSFDAGRVYGFPVNRSQEFDVVQVDDQVYLEEGGTQFDIPAGCSVVIYDPTANLANQVVGEGAIWTNPGPSDAQSFTNPLEESVNGLKAIYCTEYYKIYGEPYFDYDTSAQGAAQVHKITSGGIESQPVEITYSDNYIVVPVYEANTSGSNPTDFILLPQITSLYALPSEETMSTETRLWQFVDYKGNTKTISDNEFRSKVVQTLPLSDFNLNDWDWPLDNLEVTANVFQSYSVDGGHIDPSILKISYKNQGDSQFTEVIFSDDEDLQWKVSGLASLDFSSDTPTYLYENQTIEMSAKTDEQAEFTETYTVKTTGIDFNGETILTPTRTVDKVEIESSDNVYIEGYHKVDMEMFDENGDKYYPTLSFTYDYFDPSQDNYRKQQYPSKRVVINASSLTDGEFEKEFSYKLQKGSKYSLTIRNYQELDAFTAVVSDTNIMPLSLADSTSLTYYLYKKGTYQFLIKGTGETQTITLALRKKADQDVINVAIDPIEEIATDSGVYAAKGFQPQDVRQDINSLAFVNGTNAFNYFYVPDDNKKIENPLEASSFNNHNHFYNPFTICKVREYNILGLSNIFVNN